MKTTRKLIAIALRFAPHLPLIQALAEERRDQSN
jgi:hypothetical protein